MQLAGGGCDAGGEAAVCGQTAAGGVCGGPAGW